MPWPLSGIESKVFHLPALVKSYQTGDEKEGLERGMGQGVEWEGDVGEAKLLGQKRDGRGRENFYPLVSHFREHHVLPCGIRTAQLAWAELLQVTEHCPLFL